jgi:ADP-heptose:LPS heptosyltransferase
VPFPRPPLACHAADYFLRAVTGDPTQRAPAPRLVSPATVPPATGDAAAARVLVLLPGSGGRAKRAPADLYAELASRWRTAGGEVIVLLGPAEHDERPAWQRLAEVHEPSSIAALAEQLARATAFAGNDAGPSHVAAALGRPGVVLFTVTRDADFGPRGAGVRPVACGDHRDALARAWQALRPHVEDRRAPLKQGF